jgi:mRNA guanylyltransferase
MYFAEGDAGAEIHYLIDRKNDYYYVRGLHFPVPNDPTFQNFHIGTIIDGELVLDTLDDGSKQLKYLVFDCLMLDGNSLMSRTLDKRLAYFRDRVYNPYKELYKKYPEEKQYLPFLVEFKNMEFSYAIDMMFKKILPELRHGSDGLIFTCRNSPYKHGTDDKILKWKPESENSIDFRLNLEFPLLDPDSEDEKEGRMSPVPDYDAMPAFNLSVNYGSNRGEGYRRYATMYMTSEEWEKMKGMNIALDETIVECSQDKEGRWRFMRFREDKKEANHISTVESVMESIQDKVSEEDLRKAQANIRAAWKHRDAMLQQQRAKVVAKATTTVAGSSNRPPPPMPRTNGHGIKRKLEEAS